MYADSSLDEMVAQAGFDDTPMSRKSLGLWLLGGYLVLFLIRPWEILIPELAPLRLERVYGAILAGVLLISGRSIRWDRSSLAVVGVGCATGLSTIMAWRSDLAWPWYYQYLTVVVTYFFMQSACRAWSDVVWLVSMYVGTMGLYLGKALWEYYVHDRHWFAQNVSRLVGIEQTYGEPNAVAMSAVLSLPWWWLFWQSRDRLGWGRGSRWHRPVQWLAGLYPLIAIWSVGLTNSRAGMVGVLAFIGAWLWWRAPRAVWGRRAVWTTGLVMLLWIVAPAEQRDRLRTLWRPDLGPSNAKASAEGRWEGFRAALEMVEDRPWTGVGIGNFLTYRITFVDGVGLVAHNLPGQILGETGLIGGLAFVLLMVSIWRDARQVMRAADRWEAASPYVSLAWATEVTLLLLLLFGLSLHNGLRYNWIWTAAFVRLAREFMETDVAAQEDAVNDEELRVADAVNA